MKSRISFKRASMVKLIIQVITFLILLYLCISGIGIKYDTQTHENKPFIEMISVSNMIHID